MSAPALIIRLELEAAPKVFGDCMSEGEADGLKDWIDSNPELLDLVESALELRDEAAAA
jgi:hypothetical protein